MEGVITGKKPKKLVAMIYGGPGVGKSSLASEFPKPFFLGSETPNYMDVPRFESAVSYSEFVQQLQKVRKAISESKFPYETVVIDCLDGIEKMLGRDLVQQYGKDSKDTLQTLFGGYGKGDKLVEKKLSDLLNEVIEPIRKRANIVFVCHDVDRIKTELAKDDSEA